MRWRRVLLGAKLYALRVYQAMSPRARLYLIAIIVAGNAALALHEFQKWPFRNLDAEIASVTFPLGQYRYTIQLPNLFEITKANCETVVISIPDQRSPPQFMFSTHLDRQLQNAANCTRAAHGASMCYDEEMLPNGNGPLNRRIYGYVFWDASDPKLYFSIDDFAELSEPVPGVSLQFLRFLRREPVGEKNDLGKCHAGRFDEARSPQIAGKLWY